VIVTRIENVIENVTVIANVISIIVSPKKRNTTGLG
jgi:hypothetical protein